MQKRMPHTRKRAELMNDLDRIMRRIAVSIHQYPRRRAMLTEELQRIMRLFAMVEANRYVDPRVLEVTPADRITRFINNMNDIDDDLYKQGFRVTKDQFNHILDRIKDHDIFRQQYRHAQRPVKFQLAVALNRLGRYGNGASKGDLSTYFTIGEGTVLLYTERVIEALLSLENEVITWPSVEERHEHSQYMDIQYRLKGCVGMVDGSCIVLATRPAISGSDYFCRHRRYGVNLTAVVDHRRIFRFMCCGWPASRHDNFVYEQTPVFQQPERYFSEYEYVIGDVAYSLSPNCMCPYKLPAANIQENADFNIALSRGRVGVEHVFGLLKNRFMSLKGIPIQVTKLGDFERINRWIKTCCILHNLIMLYGDENVEIAAGVDRHAGRVGDNIQARGSGRTLREILKAYIR